jgi:cytochrome c peroxidase
VRRDANPRVARKIARWLGGRLLIRRGGGTAALRPAAAVAAGVAGAALALLVALDATWTAEWTAAEQRALRDLWIGQLGAPPPDPSNRYADDARAARLGARLFRDRRLSADGAVSCATCHRPDHAFTDGRALARGLGDGRRNTPSVVPAAYSPWHFWDGRRDSQWAQALTPIESPAEQALPRSDVARLIAAHYRREHDEIFGPWPLPPDRPLPAGAGPLGPPAARQAWSALSADEQDAISRVFANVGKALAAYQRTLRFRPSRFDRYVAQVLERNHLMARALLSSDEIAGLRLFLGRGRCTLCHRGPLFTSHEFFTLGLPFGAPGPDAGRASALAAVRADPFNCLGRYSDARRESCTELLFMTEDRGRLGVLANFKTPSLRNVAATAPYMHAGQFATLDDVLAHYASAPEVPFPEHTDIQPADLAPPERAELKAFLGTLTSEIDDPYAGEGE